MSGYNFPDVPNTPDVPSVTFTYTEEEQSPNVKIAIAGLPWIDFTKTGREAVYNRINNCNLVRIVHKYKNLLTEGDSGGKSVYSRKRHQGAPLQNKCLHIPLTYLVHPTVHLDSGKIDLVIDLFVNYADNATIIENSKTRVLSPAEHCNWFYTFGFACSKDVEIYLHDCWRKAQQTKTDPDYYGFKD